MKNKKLMLIPMLLLVFLLLAGTALAAGAVSESDTAGNSFISCDGESSECASSESALRDVYWVGNKLSLSGSNSGGDAIVAGYSMSIADSEFGGSIRAAGYEVSIADTVAENNITAAGYSVSIGSGARAAGVIAAGNEVTFDGECDSLFASGAVVRVNGSVYGDAKISADKVIFGEDAVITGHLDISSSVEPTYPAGIKDYTFTAFDKHEAEAAVAVSAWAIFTAALLGRVYWIFAMAVVALLLCLVASKELDSAGETLLKHPVAMPVTGLITLLAMPIALIILCITAIGAPTAGLLALLFAAMCFFATAFAGASASRLLLPRMNKLLASVIGVAALTLLRVVPYLGGLILFASIVYTVGYFILACYERIKALKKQPEPAAVIPEVTSEEKTEN